MSLCARFRLAFTAASFVIFDLLIKIATPTLAD